jgi:catechol 2,3-dioxygenase-like lactoylglutathione lyase family enzyme
MATQSEFSLTQIGQIAINVHDVARATAFYAEFLGMKHLFSVSGLSFFDCGGIRLMLTSPEQPEFDHPSSILYYRVPDIHAAHETLSSRGVQFEDTPHRVASMETFDLWMAFFRDSEGNLLGIMCEIPKGNER